MKKSIFNLPLLLVAAALLMFSACKKESSTEDDSVSAQDAASVSNAVAVTADDAAAAAGNVSSFSGKTEAPWWNILCGASIVDTPSNGNGQIVITYDGSVTCNGLIRSGSVTITLSNGPWKDAGAILTVSFDTLKVTDVLGGGQYTLNGIHTIKNETGGLAWKVVAGIDQSLTVAHRGESSDMTVTFSDGSQRVWSIDRTQSFASVIAGGVNTITINDYSEHSGNNDSWGTNRYGNSFINSISDTISANNMPNDNFCQWLPYQGKYLHQISNRSAIVLFGADDNGNQIGTPTHCGNDGYFITYTNAHGQTGTKFIEYIHHL